MTPQTKATVITVCVLVGMVIVPVTLIVLRDWLLAAAVIVIYSFVLWLFFSEAYRVLRQYFLAPMIEDQQATQAFNGDPLKMHFYRGFRKFFNGNVNEQELQHWLERHRPQI